MSDDAFAPDFEIDDAHLLRTAQNDDIDQILRIENLCQPAPWTRHVFEKEFDLEFSRTWVVEERREGRIFAFLTFWIVHDELHILNICVHPEARRRGLARRLLDELTTRGRKQRASLISLEVRESNAAAQALYGSLGFIAIGQREHYYADNGEDAVLLALLLEG